MVNQFLPPDILVLQPIQLGPELIIIIPMILVILLVFYAIYKIITD